MKYVFQINGNVIVIFSDVWSLGCVLYEMLTLKHAVRTNPVSPYCSSHPLSVVLKLQQTVPLSY